MNQLLLDDFISASQQTITLIANNKCPSSLDTLAKICSILKIDISSLLDKIHNTLMMELLSFFVSMKKKSFNVIIH